MPTLGLDIGGANIKASDGQSRSVSRPFAIWKAPEQLPEELAALLADFPEVDHLAVTMTAELADCFATKAEGVRRILDSVLAIAGERVVLVWQTAGEFVSADLATEFPRLVAAANWHALATWVGRSCPEGSALLIDCGSTTTDFIPLQDGLPSTLGLTDVERLQHGELVYTGLKRTSICALAPAVPFQGRLCPLAAELFATTLDVALLTGTVAPDPHDLNTADGRPATVEAAWNRLAHQICCDTDECSLDEARQIAGFLRDRQLEAWFAAERIVAARFAPWQTVITSGEGEASLAPLVEQIGETGKTILSLNQMLGPQHSQAACAFALARLLEDS